MLISEATGFDWDQGNRGKCAKHGLSFGVIESVFHGPVTILPDEKHSLSEQRLKAIGQDRDGRYVFIVFTLRERQGKILIRPISARYMHEKESKYYEETNSNF